MEIRFQTLLIAVLMLPGGVFADCATDIAELAERNSDISNFESEFLKALSESSLARAIERVEKKVEGYRLPKALSDAVVREITNHLSRKISRAISSAQMDFVIRQAKVLAEQNKLEISNDFLQAAVAENKNWQKLVVSLFEPDQTPAEKKIASYNLSRYLYHLITGNSLLQEEQKRDLELFSNALASRLGDERKNIVSRSTTEVLGSVDIDRLILDQGLPYLKSIRDKLEGRSKELSDRFLLSLYNRISSYVRAGVESESDAQTIIEEAMTKATLVFVEKIIEDIASNGISEDKTRANELQRNRIINYVIRMTELDRFVIAKYFPKLNAAISQVPEQKREAFESILYPLTRAFKDKSVRYTRDGRRSWSDARDFFDEQAAITALDLFSRPAAVIDFPDLIQDKASLIEYIMGEVQMKEDLGLDFANSELDMTQWATAVRLWPSFSQHLLAVVFADEGSYEDVIEVFPDAAIGFFKAIKSEPIDQLVKMNQESGSGFVANAKSRGLFEYNYRAFDRVLPPEFESRMHLLNQEQQKLLRAHFPIVSAYLSKRVAWVSKKIAQDLVVFQIELIDQIFNIWPDAVEDLKSRKLSGSKNKDRNEMRDSLYALSSMTKTEVAEIQTPLLSFRNSLSSEPQRLLFESLLLKLQTNFISDIGPIKADKELEDAKARFDEWFQEEIVSDAVGIRLENDGSFLRRRTVLSKMTAEIRREWVRSQAEQNVREEVRALVHDEIGSLLEHPTTQKMDESLNESEQKALEESRVHIENNFEEKSTALTADKYAAPVWKRYFHSGSGSGRERIASNNELFEIYRPWLEEKTNYYYGEFKGKRNGFDKDEFFSWAFIGFIDAVSKYELDAGRFTAYAASRVRGAILDALRENSFVPRSVLERSIIVDKVESDFFKQNSRMPSEMELRSLVRDYLIIKGGLGTGQIDAEAEKIIRDGASRKSVSYGGDNWAVSREPQADEKITKEVFWNYILRGFDDRKLEIIKFFYKEGLPVREIALRMDLTEATVRHLKREILSSLEGRFSRLSDEELKALLSN